MLEHKRLHKDLHIRKLELGSKQSLGLACRQLVARNESRCKARTLDGTS